MENDYEQLKQQVNDLQNKLDAFLDIYYRSDYPDKYVFNKKVVLNNQDLNTEGTNGMKIGNSGSKLSFMGATPVSKQSAISAPSSPGATYVQSEAQSAVNAINSIRTVLQNYGLTS